MAYYKGLDGFEFHEKVTSGSYDYYVYVNKHAQTLIRRMHSTTESTRYCLTTDALATVIADVTAYDYKTLDNWKL